MSPGGTNILTGPWKRGVGGKEAGVRGAVTTGAEAGVIWGRAAEKDAGGLEKETVSPRESRRNQPCVTLVLGPRIARTRLF